MAYIPGSPYRVPGVFGPIDYYVELIEENKYSISWGKMIGTPREIAKQIVLTHFNNPEEFEARKNYVGPFFLTFKPEMKCMFCMGFASKSNVNMNELQDLINEELKILSVFIPFS